MGESKALEVLCTYSIKKGKESEFLHLLERHWPTLHRLGLSTDDPARVLRGQNKAGDSVFIESFAWKDASFPNVAHQTPEVMAIWEPMGALVTDMHFWQVEPVEMKFAEV